jgi:DNA polymerase sigma
MSHLSAKSMQNFAAFDLFSDKFHAPAIHCAYYSCFQKLCAYLKEEEPRGFETVYERWQGQKGSMHGGILQLASNSLRAIDKDDAKVFNTELKNLFNLRVLSDYYDVEVTKSNVEDAKKILSKINQILKRRFRC